MISDKRVAEQVLATMHECSGAFDRSVRLVRETCSEEEFRAYRKAIGQVMGAMYFEVYRPLFQRFPDLEPESFKPE